MEEFQAVLLNVWREACRHIEITQSTATIAAMLVEWMPLNQVLVRRFDRQRSSLETVAVGFAPPGAPLPNVRTICSATQLKSLLTWCAQGEIVRIDREMPISAEWDFLVPSGHEGDVLIGPLGQPDAPSGVLILCANARRSFNPRHVALVQRLLEPFSIALENDQRLREMAALREAAEADNRSLLARLGRKQLVDTIVGADAGLRAVMERVELVAPSDAPVLIFGDTGTGKELIARAIHARSRRSAGPFDRVNCGAIPPELIDSQLFGHERGAFTGAVETRRGWFERANGGTLFLDEIGDLPLAAQVRMLRILQDGWMERVGGEQSIQVDVRIIAATHRDLAAMVAEGRFREDLWYRIAVFPVVLPTLRERREDISRLAAHFAERAATRFGLALVMPTPQDLELLLSYPWPGNVRELAAVIDRAAILGEGKTLEVAKALGVATTQAIPSTESIKIKSSLTALPTAIETLDAALRRHIETALAMTNGRIEGQHGAALMLEINPHTLRAKMRKLGVDWKRFR
ncbi:MAG TPA: sigma 54-interacting transcriptional regulator, partial [Thermoguttaceae bacterium]